MDIALAGKTAMIESIEQDYEGNFHSAWWLTMTRVVTSASCVNPAIASFSIPKITASA